MERQQIFQRLRQPCIQLLEAVANLAQSSTAKQEVVQALTHLLQRLKEATPTPESLDAKLAEFVFVPISRVLQVSGIVPVRALELSLECISILLKTGWRTDISPDLTGQLLILFTFLANASSAENGIPATSEELQSAAFKCMHDLLVANSSGSAAGAALTKTENIPALGKTVLVMLDSIVEVRSNDVKIQAISALKALSSSINDVDALASFLPRMVSSLTKVLTPSSSQRTNFRLLVHALDTLSILFLRVLSDIETKNLPAGDVGPDKFLRTQSWLKATAAQIKVALAIVFKLRTHDKLEVRRALQRLCMRIIQDCRVSLSESTSIAMETLVTLTEYGGKQDAAEEELRILLYSDLDLANLLRESLYDWVLSLPGLMQSKDDAGRKQIIHRVSTALRLLDSGRFSLCYVNQRLADSLRDSLTTIFNASRSSQALVAPTSEVDIREKLVLHEKRFMLFQPLKLRFKGQDDMLKEFKLLLHEIAKSDAALDVAQELLETKDTGSKESRLASFWLSVGLLTGVIERDSSLNNFLDLGKTDKLTDVLEELFTYSLNEISHPEADLESDWLLHALALEGIALQARKHKVDFRGELLDVLYPVLHLLGSSNPTVQEHAIVCLNIISSSCGYSDARDLVISNVDYVVNTVNFRLYYADLAHQAPQVLLMTLRLCGPSLLPYLDDVVRSMFSLLRLFHGYPKLVGQIFAVFKAMAEEAVRTPQLLLTVTQHDVHENKPWKATQISEVVKISEGMKSRTLKEDDEHQKEFEGSFPRKPWKDEPTPQAGEGFTENEKTTEAQTTEPSPPAPRTFDLLLKISEVTQHYLTSSSPTLRTSLLSLLYITIPALAKHEDSLLPLINSLWPVLLPRLEDPEAYVVANALDIVALTCTHAKNFMRGRIESVWEDIKAIHRRTTTRTDDRREKDRMKPTSRNLLHDESDLAKYTIEPNLTLNHPGIYIDAPSRMIWDSLVRLLVAIAEHVAVHEDKFDDVLDMLDPVFDQSDVRAALASRNPDAMWLHEHRKYKLEQDYGSVLSRSLLPEINLPAAMAQGWDFVQL